MRKNGASFVLLMKVALWRSAWRCGSSSTVSPWRSNTVVLAVSGPDEAVGEVAVPWLTTSGGAGRGVQRAAL